jgi:GT2 family glycosyltransferase
VLTPAAAAELMSGFDLRPRISIVTPVYRIAPDLLDECIASVASQYYPDWELVLVDDGSERPELTALMTGWANRDERIRLGQMERNSGIAAATNAGLEAAGGEYVAFLDHDDELTPDALTRIVEAINANPAAKWLYSDEAVVSASGRLLGVRNKPGYDPCLLLAQMYTCHLSVYSSALIEEVGGLRAGFEGSQDHDLALRAAERVSREEVRHVPHVLYRWRATGTSTASSLSAKPMAAAAGRRAVGDALVRRGVGGDVRSWPPSPTVYMIAPAPRATPAVTVIVPTRNRLDLLAPCLESLRSRTAYPEHEVLVIDHESDDPETLSYLQREAAAGRLRVMPYRGSFNHSEMNNRAVNSVDSELVVLMNNDVEMSSDAWLENMVGTLQLDDAIAAVGALLSYPNNRVQHAGMGFGDHGLVEHRLWGLYDGDAGPWGMLQSLQEQPALTAALLLLRRSAFTAVGGFRADRYPAAGNDFDLCMRLRQGGHRCVYNPVIRALHRESASRRPWGREEIRGYRRLRKDWGARRKGN